MSGKRRVSFILAVLMTAGIFLAVLGAFPAQAHAAFGEIWVGGVRVTDENMHGIQSKNIKGSVTYDPVRQVLTLKNATVSFLRDPKIAQRNAALFVGGSTGHLTIELIGYNYLISGNDGVNDMAAVYANSDLTITGSGSLTAYGTKKNEEYPRGRSCYGICVPDHTLSINGTRVNLYADETPYELSYGAYAKCILINYSHVNATAYSYAYDIYDRNQNLIGRGSTEDGIGLYGTIAINYSNVFATGGRYAIGRTPKLKNVVTDIQFKPCEYKDYTVFTCRPVRAYNICVGGIWITEENKNNVQGSQISGKVQYDPDRQLLTLRCAYVMGDDVYGIGEGIYTSLPDLTIRLIGKNGVVSGDFGQRSFTAISASKLRLTGTGTLTARARPDKEPWERPGFGICCGTLTIESGTVIAIGKTNAIMGGNLPYYQAAKAGMKMNGDGAHRFSQQEYDLSRQYRVYKWDTVKYFSLTVPGAASPGIPNTGDETPIVPLAGIVLLCGAALLLRRRRLRTR